MFRENVNNNKTMKNEYVDQTVELNVILKWNLLHFIPYDIKLKQVLIRFKQVLNYGKSISKNVSDAAQCLLWALESTVMHC